ncbi:MAG: carboxypeptidase-like regulatory domain-containing protein [Candidatus ainarchaeum sp.]|nr:carboxypeptidase-like regulatory domain-containing protein [Candidatus ainarchaeum sp.]
MFDDEDKSYLGTSPTDYSMYDDYGKAPGNKIDLTNIKKILPKLIIGLIFLIVIFLIWNWFSSHQTLEFNITNKEGKSINDARISVINNSNNSRLTEQNGKYTLAPGLYTIRISADGYEEYLEKELVFPDDGFDQDIILMRDYSELSSELILDKTEYYSLEEVKGTIKLRNNSSEDYTNLKIKISASDINFENSERTITELKSQTSTDISILGSTKKTDKDITSNIKIEFINSEKIEKQTVLIHPKIELSKIVTTPTTELTNSKLEAGKDTTIDLIIANKHKTFALEDIKVDLVIEDKDKLNSWITFKDTTSYEKEIEFIDKEQNQTITFNITPDLSAKKGDEFTAKIIISAKNLDGIKELPVKLTIGTEKNVDIYAPSGKVNQKCSTTECGLVEKYEYLISNKGNVDIKNITLRLSEETVADCQSFFNIINEMPISEIKAGDSKLILMNIGSNAYSSSLIDKTIKCYFVAEYTDPLTNSKEVSNLNNSKIELTISD